MDSAGRIVFVRWDHLQRDQQADTDWEEGYHHLRLLQLERRILRLGATTNLTEVFPEPRGVRTDLLAGTGLAGNTIQPVFPLGHRPGRHGRGNAEPHRPPRNRRQLRLRRRFTNDPNIAGPVLFRRQLQHQHDREFSEGARRPERAGIVLRHRRPGVRHAWRRADCFHHRHHEPQRLLHARQLSDAAFDP